MMKECTIRLTAVRLALIDKAKLKRKGYALSNGIGYSHKPSNKRESCVRKWI